MKKKGYTLAEALITLGIIGIIAALVVPAANKARPNENKIRFLQTYDAIETQIKNFAQNSRYFPTCQDFPDPNNPGNRINLCFPDYPLYNTSGGVEDDRGRGILVSTPGSNPPDRPLPSNYNPDNDGPDKLCYLLADAMDAITDMPDRCGNNIPSFVTPNGVAIWFDNGMSWHNLPNANGDGLFLKTIFFDVTGDFDQDRGGGVSDNPARFTIAVTADGSVYPNDTAGAQYLEHRKDTREKFNLNEVDAFSQTIIFRDLNDQKQHIIFSN